MRMSSRPGAVRLTGHRGEHQPAGLDILRDQARARNLRLAEPAQSFADGTETLIGPAAKPPRRRPR
jgi:hypothetical protein